MSQWDVLEVLKNHFPRWMNRREISNNLKISDGNVNTNLYKLRQSKFITFKKDQKTQFFLYKYNG